MAAVYGGERAAASHIIIAMRLIAISLVSIAILAGLLAWNSLSSRAPGVKPIIVYCAIALQPPIEELAREYDKEVGVAVQVEYGGSQVLLARIDLRKQGDLYIPADDDYLRKAEQKSLVESRVPLTRLHPVIAVAAGNPLGVKSVDDMVRKEVRTALPDPNSAAIGRLVRSTLGTKWDKIWAKNLLLRETVGDVAGDVAAHAVDATFVWDETTKQVKGLAAIEVPEFANVEAQVAAGILA